MAEIIRRPKEEFIKMIKSGAVRKVAPVDPTAPESEKKDMAPGSLDLAKKLFGKYFLGDEVIEKLNRELRLKEINVKFDIPQIPFPYSEDEVRKAYNDRNQNKTRMVILRPGFMVIRNTHRLPVTIKNLIRYAGLSFSRDSRINFVTEQLNKYEQYRNIPLEPCYAFPTIEVVPDSTEKDFEEQKAMIPAGEHRRSAVETIWDIFLSRRNNIDPLAYGIDLTSSEDRWGRNVSVSKYVDSIYFSLRKKDQISAFDGVCTQIVKI